MSKRYGRNQKRRARVRIARLEFEKEQLNRTIDNNRSTLNTAKDIIYMLERVNPRSVIFEVRPIHPHHYICSDHRFDPCLSLPSKGYNPSERIDIRTIDLYDLEVEMQSFQDMVHFECTMFNPNTGKLKSAYRISAEGFKYQPTDKIVTELVRQLKHNVGGIN